MNLVVDIASWLLFAIGGLLMVTTGLGLVRLPNVFARLHAGGIGDTGASAALLLGMALQAGWSMVTVKLVLIGIFLFFTAPTATHALAHAAILGGLSPDRTTENQSDEDRDPDEA